MHRPFSYSKCILLQVSTASDLLGKALNPVTNRVFTPKAFMPLLSWGHGVSPLLLCCKGSEWGKTVGPFPCVGLARTVKAAG